MAEQKRTLWQQLMFLDYEINRIDIWESVYRNEGKLLPAAFTEHRVVLRCLRSTIELLYANEADVKALIRKKRAMAGPSPPQEPELIDEQISDDA